MTTDTLKQDVVDAAMALRGWWRVHPDSVCAEEFHRLADACDALAGNKTEAQEDLDAKAKWENDGNLPFILDYIVHCAKGWEPKARILGNARAEDIVLAIGSVKRRLEWHKKRTDMLASMRAGMREPERTMVCDVLANGTTLVPVQRAVGRFQSEDKP